MDLLNVAEGGDWEHGSKLLLVEKPHRGRDEVHNRWRHQSTSKIATTVVAIDKRGSLYESCWQRVRRVQARLGSVHGGWMRGGQNDEMG